MKISLHWLGDFLTWKEKHQRALIERITLSIAEVEDIEEQSALLDLSKLGIQGSKPEAGMPLRNALGADTILHISNAAITHRPDLFSHLGVARECRAAGLARWKGGKEPARHAPTFPSASLPFSVELRDASLVPRYLACTLELPAQGETPAWMKARLKSVGARSISLPVDITNYVMLEMGAPLHAFDAAKIRGTKIVFRAADRGEVVTTLDGVQRTLPEGAIVLSDDEGIFDLCGLMGDIRTATTETTHTLFLHAPVFDPVSTRRTIQATGLRSDASTIFEKGVPPISAVRAFLRALELFLELCPGTQITSKLLQWGTDGRPQRIALSIENLQGTIGLSIAPKTAVSILKGLGCTVRATKTALTVTPPFHRLRDLKTDADLIEEVSRLHGYDRIHPVMPDAPLCIPARDQRLHALRDALREEGFTEIVPLSLVGSALLQRCAINPDEAIVLQHPLTEEEALLQPSTLPGLLEHAQRNVLHAGNMLRTFHCGHVFGRRAPEHTECGLLLGSFTETSLPDDPFLQLKSVLQCALDRAGYTLSIAPLPSPPHFAHPGRSAMLVVNGQSIGTLFEVHPLLRSHFDLGHRAAAALLNLDALFVMTPQLCPVKPIPAFPAVTYDVTLTRSQGQPFADLMARLRGSHPLLEHIDVHDFYAGPPLKGGEYNLTLRCTYRSPERTLTEEEAKAAHEKVVALAMS